MQSRSGISSGWMTKEFNLISVISLLPRSDSAWIIAMWLWSFDAPAVQLFDGSQIGLLASGNYHFFRQSSHFGFSTETLLETTKTFYNINRNLFCDFHEPNPEFMLWYRLFWVVCTLRNQFVFTKSRISRLSMEQIEFTSDSVRKKEKLFQPSEHSKRRIREFLDRF